MRISNAFVIHAPVERSWELLTDLKALIPCIPGVRLTGTEEATHLAEACIKVGPAVVSCHGTARLVDEDADTRRIVVEAAGRSRRGSGSGTALITAGLHERGPDTLVTVTTDLELTGGLSRWSPPVLTEVADGLMERCARRLDERVLCSGTASAPVEPEPGEATGQRLWSAAAILVVVGGMLLGYLLFG